MPDREAIIDAMAGALWVGIWPNKMPLALARTRSLYDEDVAHVFEWAEVAYDASPIERYRKALEEIVSGYYESAPYVVTARRALRGDD